MMSICNLSFLVTVLRTALAASPALRTVTQFGSFLSPEASIYFPGSDSFDTATQRWQEWRPPHFLAAVEVANAKDVQHTVINPFPHPKYQSGDLLIQHRSNWPISLIYLSLPSPVVMDPLAALAD